MAKQYKYHLLGFADSKDTGAILNTLNQAGQEGWQVVSTIYTTVPGDQPLQSQVLIGAVVLMREIENTEVPHSIVNAFSTRLPE